VTGPDTGPVTGPVTRGRERIDRVRARANPPLRLHLNEHTGGCSPAVLAAIRDIPREDVARYPDYAPVTHACQRHFGVDAGWVTLTNGLDEGLHAAAYAVARATRHLVGDRPTVALIVEPAFEMYAACADAAGLDVRRVLPGDDPAFPVEACLAALSPEVRLIYLTDPNNPTGLAIPPGLVDRICQAAPQALVMLDEAYGEYSGRTAIGPALERHRNLVVGRTFAKAYGLAGLRVGAVVAHPETMAPLLQVLPPFPLNICAVRALEAALEDRAYLESSIAQAAESRGLVAGACHRLGLHAWPSEANFVLVRIGDEVSRVVDEMAAGGVLIRDRSQQPGCAGCGRITAGVVEHTRVAIAALEAALMASRRTNEP
jgi:histidinol-phosphate aminotransferase